MKRTKPTSKMDDRKYWASQEEIDFLQSLPASFTVLEEVWPREWTGEYLRDLVAPRGHPLLTNPAYRWQEVMLELATIAPGPRKRKVTLWERTSRVDKLIERDWVMHDQSPLGGGWRKVGECEIEEG